MELHSVTPKLRGIMPYRELTDNQLVETLLTNACAQEKAETAGELFQRYCEKCDRRIRAVFQSRGLEYSDANSYYNTVFFAIYERIFEVENLIRKLTSYEVTRGVFERWLLRVVTSETIDWLRRMDPKTGLSNAFTVFPDNQTISESEEKQIEKKLALRDSPGKPSWERELSEEAPTHHIQQALSQLSDELRVTMRLRFLGYCELESCDMAYLSKTSAGSAEDIATRIKNFQQDIRNSEAFLAAEQQELELAVLTERVEYFHRKMLQLKPVLETLGYSQRELSQVRRDIQKGLSGEPDSLTFHYQEIKILRKKLRERYAAKQIDARKFAREEKLLTYQETVKRWMSTQQKKEHALQAYYSGAQALKLSYEQVAAFLNISPGTVASRINRAKKALERTRTKHNETNL